MSINFPIRLDNYTLTTQIGETASSTVYRAIRSGSRQTVVVKALRTPLGSPAQVARLKHEYDLIRGIDIDGIIKTIDFIDQNGMLALVLEDFGGISLKEVISEGFSLDRFLKLAIRIAEILAKLHQANISHRDIKPHNILLNPQTDVIKITDFGIAAETLPIDHEMSNPVMMEGTLPYIAPEQTGRMNCAVDYRADLYSLGITFYEMLTGQVPFRSKNAVEIIHAHIARMPVAPNQIDPDIPVPVSDIVMKLLSKSAGDRYQNSFGLVADLRECLKQFQMTGRIKPFPLGTQDISPRFIIPQTLVGRDKEKYIFLETFERISHGRMEILLIAGEAGIGKSSLVHEMSKPLIGKRGYFIFGKFDQFRRTVPLSAIKQAFQGFVQQLLTQSDSHLQTLKSGLLAALGPNGKIITDAIPEIEMIIGKQPDVPDLDPEETQNRFNLCFKNFIRVFADEKNPLILFMDDLQWADPASLHLLQILALDRDLRHALFIGAYRDSEGNLDQAIVETFNAVCNAGCEVNTIRLAALKPQDINKLIDSLLQCAPDASMSLAQIVFDKTKGNPFFVNQFLKMLHDQRYISFDPAYGWIWDLHKIQQLQVTENVVQFMSDKLYHLPDDHLDIIKLCACIGNRFDIETLAFITRRSLDDILSIVDALAAEGLISCSGEVCRFQHNRIQEAAYLLVKPSDRERIHYDIGQRELYSTPSEQIPSRIFYICDHLNLAHRMLATQAERNQLAELNIKAGIKAKESTAYASAVNYFEAGIDLIGRDAWQSAYDPAYVLYCEQMECQYLNRNFDEAERLFKIILANASTKLDKAKAFNTMIKLYTTIRPPREAVELGLTALKIFNMDLRINMGLGPVAAELIKAGYRLRKIGIDKIIDLPRMQDKEMLVTGELMLNVGYPAYYMNKNLVAFMSMRVANDSLRHGLAPYTSIGFIVMANLIQISLGNYDVAYRLSEMALKLNDILDNRRLKGAVLHNFAYFIQHWKKHVRHDLEIYLTVYELAMNTGDFIFVGHSINAAAEIRLMLDHKLDDILDDLKKHDDFISLSKNAVISREYRQIIQFILALKGLTPVRHDLSTNEVNVSEFIDQTRAEGNDFGLCLALYHKIVLLFLYRKYDEAYQAARELDQHSTVFLGTIMMTNHYFYYSLILIGLLREGDRRQRKFKSIIRRNLRALRKWADLCPENFRHMHDLVAAEFAGLEGRFRAAVELYHAAINNARNHDFLPVQAIACELLAAFYVMWNHPAEAGVFIRRALNGYILWGAKAKEQDLQERYPDILRADKMTASTETDTKTTSSESSSRMLDFTTIMDVSQVIASEIRLEALLQKTMHLSIANAGAQRGFLILIADGRLQVQASEDVLTGESRVLQAIALDQCEGISAPVVQYVHRSGTPLVLGNASQEEKFRNDPHIVEHRCKSILCLPLLNKGTMMAILYMENNLATGAFTPEHLKILQIIASQAAISLQNAKLYEDITAEITARKKTEEALRISEEKYRTILEEMKDIYSETDLNGNLTFVNPALCKLTGYTKDELLGTSIRIFTDPKDHKRNEHFYRRRTYADSPASLFTTDIIGKNRKVTCMENIVTPIRNKAGVIVGFRNLGRDITERKRLEQNLVESYQKMQNVRIATILGLAKLAEYRDEATGAHLERIREYARILARELAAKPEYKGYITAEYIEDIYNSSILHDIGKVGIPDAILLKPARLTPEEFEVIKIHTTLGGDVLKAVEGKIEGQSFLTLGKEIAYYHHEKWDGTGYPSGLAGTDIPLSARIVALADVYDALTSKRVYKDAFSHFEAMDIIVKDRGTHFAPDVVDAFMMHAEDFRKIREELLGN